MTTTTVRWGIAATGRIAASFVEDLALLDGHEVVAVGSRTAAGAEAFGERCGIPHRHGAYADLATDPDVDVVYVASPQAGHAPHTLLFLEAGKHVLCEKPFALNAAEAAAMIDAATSRGLFVMEALWSRFLPAYVELRRLLDIGQIGTPQVVDSDFGFRLPIDPGHRLFDLERGGGALLDLGIYPLQLATLVLGAPASVVAAAHLGETGVDESTFAVVTHEGGGHSVSKASIRTPFAGRARIAGTDGVIELPSPMHVPRSLTLTVGDDVQRIETPFDGNGLRFQAVEVAARIAAGDVESPVMPHAETLRLAMLMDEIRTTIGLRFPGE
ncbi:Gfo/Idh/MocA family protein [Desertimonas flava]|uniref:Gfo/Idh/MocA family protein n=1 Tax=Desertimonas flava TaxID=2064846 RepID=UPI000E351439|nr:Gfo/Idh/MocA family oxidoreductase [Desertimonas flava]